MNEAATFFYLLLSSTPVMEDTRPRQKRRLSDSLDQVVASYNLVYKLRILSFLTHNNNIMLSKCMFLLS